MKFSRLIPIYSLLTLASSHAAVVFYDTFNRTDAAILGTTASDTGGTWTITGTSVVSPITVTSNAVTLANTGQDAFSAFSAAASLSSSTLYSSLNINVSATQATGDYFFHLSDPVGSASNFYQRLFLKSGTTGKFLIGIAGSSTTAPAAPTYGTTELSLGTNYQVVIAWSAVAGALNDQFDIYIDPTDPTEANNTAYLENVAWSASGAEPTQLSSVNLRQGSGTAAATLTVDNVKVATSFNDIVPVPEPMTGAMLVAGLGLCSIRRRK